MRDPGAVVAVGRLALLVDLHLRERLGVRLLVVLDRDLRGHPAHRVDVAAVAGLDQELRVALQEVRGHRDQRAVGEAEVAVAAQLLDAREDVVPAAGVEPRRVLAQLVQDLVHLERRDDRLDQHGRLDRAARNAQRVLRHHEDVVPQPRLEVALELRQVEVRPRAARDQLLRVVERVEREVEDPARDRLAVDLHVLLRQVPAARAHEQHGELLAQPVDLPFRRRELDPAADRVGEVDVALDVVVPARRVRVLEVRHEDARARVERVDDHLAVDGAGDLDAAILDVGGDARAGPVAVAHRARLREEVGQLAGVELRLPLRAHRQELGPARPERALQLRGERDRLGGQDPCVLGGDASGDLDAGAVGGRAHGTLAWMDSWNAAGAALRQVRRRMAFVKVVFTNRILLQPLPAPP